MRAQHFEHIWTTRTTCSTVIYIAPRTQPSTYVDDDAVTDIVVVVIVCLASVTLFSLPQRKKNETERERKCTRPYTH